MSPSLLLVTTVPITLEAFLLPYAARMRELGWRVDALANGATGAAALQGGFDDLFDAGWSRRVTDPGNLVGTPADVRRIVHEGAYDIVHVHTPVAAFVTRYALRDRRDPVRPRVIYTAHGFHFLEGQSARRNAVFRTMERLAAPWTDYLVTINAEDRAAAATLGVPDPDHVRYIPGIGVDTERYAPATDPEIREHMRSKLGIASDAVLITCVAEFAPVKRHAHLLRAFAEARLENAVLLLVGEGPLEGELRELVVTLDLRERVVFAGYRRDVPDVLAATDALVLASEREGLNRSVLEAMACGVPVVGTRTRGIADAVEPGAGWIADTNDVTALASALAQAAADPQARATRGTTARERAVSEFSLARTLAAYEELYREALG